MSQLLRDFPVKVCIHEVIHCEKDSNNDIYSPAIGF